MPFTVGDSYVPWTVGGSYVPSTVGGSYVPWTVRGSYAPLTVGEKSADCAVCWYMKDLQLLEKSVMTVRYAGTGRRVCKEGAKDENV